MFLYDHGSTHGTSINYKPVKAFEFHEVQDGDIVRFGESTRIIIVHIEEEDDEEVADREEAEEAREEEQAANDEEI